jgi:hypothetical protein
MKEFFVGVSGMKKSSRKNLVFVDFVSIFIEAVEEDCEISYF